MINVPVWNDGNETVFADLGVAQCEGLEWIHVAQDTVLWYNLCEYIIEKMGISSLAEQPQASNERLCFMEFIKLSFHFVLCTLLSVEHWNSLCHKMGYGLYQTM